MSAIIGLRDGVSAAVPYSPAKEKATTRGVYHSRSPLMRRRHLLSGARVKLHLAACIAFATLLIAGRIGSIMGWNPSPSSSVSSPSGGGYTVLINTWKRNSLLKQAVAHYASCSGTDAIRVVWSERDPPSESLKAYLSKIVLSKSQSAHKPNFRFDLNEEDNLNNRFKPIKDLRTDAIFSVDDDKDGVAYYSYGGWWSVWWMGTYSMVVSKAAFFHRKYLDLYTYQMPSSIHDYVTRERNCEDIAMSLLVANATSAPPIWVKGKIYEIGASGISSLKGHSKTRNKCLNDFVSLYGTMPLISTNVKAVDSRHEWFW